MLHRVFLPQLGQTMEEGRIEKWRKAEGDTVEKGEILYELTTDKATLEVEAFADGTLLRILVGEGVTVPVNRLIAVIGDPGDEVPDDLCTQPAGAEAPVRVAGRTPMQPPQGAEAPQPQQACASPRARQVAREALVPLRVIQGSGPGGRVVERDVRAYMDRTSSTRATPAARREAYEAGVDLSALCGPAGGGRITRAEVSAASPAEAATPERRLPLSPMRRTIAQRMAEAKRTIPHFYLGAEVRLGSALDHLQALCERTQQKVTVTALFVKAIGLALRAHPRVNVRFEGEWLCPLDECDVGVAVSVDDGLFVPVVRSADSKGLAAIASELSELADAARQGRLLPEQYEGGSVTLTNLGMYGVDSFQAIINPPECLIVSVGAVRDSALVDGGEVRAGRLVTVCLSVDHRAVDGVQAAAFLGAIRQMLEEPELITG
jgi:pyruvate dehydrogenase E2 component (dihydrolipoamide acetyltransferase)